MIYDLKNGIEGINFDLVFLTPDLIVCDLMGNFLDKPGL
jgi:hypothetical protein